MVRQCKEEEDYVYKWAGVGKIANLGATTTTGTADKKKLKTRRESKIARFFFKKND